MCLIAGALSAPALGQLKSLREGTGFAAPVFAAAPPGSSNTLWVVQQGGTIRTLDLAGGSGTTPGSTILTEPNITFNGERGLLGMAFHPSFATNGQFYIYKTDGGPDADIEIARYTFSGGAATNREVVLKIPHPTHSNHNGGWMSFGPDGYLYVGTGDGGGANDPFENAQNKNALLGKMLRLDMSGDDFPGDANKNYKIPPTNPGVGVANYADEIWAYGLRNPWRNAFDRTTGDLWIADVGDTLREEINKQAAGSAGGQNYGWDIREGSIDNSNTGGTLDPADRVDPIYDYSSSASGFGSITGGYVYRGPTVSDGTKSMEGLYFFADYRTGNIWTLEQVGAGVTIVDRTAALMTPDVGGAIGVFDVVSFAQDNLGNMYIIDYDGEIFRIVPEPSMLGVLGMSFIALRRRR
ncbi:MAG: PQQ-dependent sugar dehydrogenase [Burkholderiales bacterium]|nr:PQQ-dependent sugar dehydrogenase [Phycisphaerae bacterium]